MLVRIVERKIGRCRYRFAFNLVAKAAGPVDRAYQHKFDRPDEQIRALQLCSVDASYWTD
jgi:hypothetical protein